MGVLDEPFPGSWAVGSHLLTRWELRSKFDRIFEDVYAPKGFEFDAQARALAAVHWAKGDCVVGGLAAAALLGARWIDPTAAVELIVGTRSRAPAGIVLRRDHVPAEDLTTAHGVAVTTPARTAFDIGRRFPTDAAVIAIDDLCNRTGLHVDAISRVADANAGVRGLLNARRAVELVDPGAESPPESRVRLALVRGGLPRPTTQVKIRDESGQIVARADLGYERWRTLVEYDGAHHWLDARQRAWDIERRYLVDRLGYRTVWVNAAHLRTPWLIVDRVRTELRAAGAPV